MRKNKTAHKEQAGLAEDVQLFGKAKMIFGKEPLIRNSL
jgi:hypothetical protein